MSATHSGRCFCGKVRFAVTEPIRNRCFCHCESCRRAAGSPYIAWGKVLVEPMMHIWVQDKLPWVQINDGRPQYQTVPGAAS